MPFVLIMCQIHHLIREKEGENLQIVHKSTPTNTKRVYPIITGCYQLINDFCNFSAAAKMILNSMVEFEKQEAE